MKITSQEIRQKYIDFFREKEHAIIPSAPVVPENDPTVLFTTAGMHPLVPYLMWQKHPLGKRLADYQKCIRTGDIDDVWDNTHLTFFEMLGNWSLGDYFKKESIAWSYELLVERMGIDPRKLAVTVFEWDSDAPRDDESVEIWKWVGIPESRISYLPKEDNWWGPAGLTGPCGPDTEIFYWVGETEFPPEGSNVKTEPKKWMEIWNNVFMQYNKNADGTFSTLEAQCVDTGMWLERITSTLNGVKTVYDTDIFQDILEVIEHTLGQTYTPETQKSMRIIADHMRTSVMIISDGVTPSNVDQGYVLRRLLRRAIREGFKLGKKEGFLTPIAEKIISKFEDIYTHLKEKRVLIIEEIQREEKQFIATLWTGLKEFEKLMSELAKTSQTTISWDQAFHLYDTFGFPIEMTKELATEKGLVVDEEGFKKAFEKHQELSRAGSEQKFKWGLADHSDATTGLHSATHLMLAGLRKYLGEHVHQAGSNITAERLRFDFTHPEPVTKEQLQMVEDYVNEAIQADAQVVLTEMDKEEAKASGVEGSFWERYPERVKVYSFASADGRVFSKELCGGPHVEHTGTMGKFKIQKEESSSRGVRRIKAVLEK